MKKLLTVVLCLLLVFAFVACSTEKEYEGEYSKTLKTEASEKTVGFKVKLQVKVDTSAKKVLSVTYVEVDGANLDSRTGQFLNNETERDAFIAKLANTSFDLYKDLVDVEYYQTTGGSDIDTAQSAKYEQNFGNIIVSNATNGSAFLINAVAKILKENSLI